MMSKKIYKQIHDPVKLEYFKEIVPGHFVNEISDLYYERFGERLSKTDIENIKRTYGLYSKINNCRKGEYPEHLRKTVEKHTKELGYERIRKRKDGQKFIEVKIGQGKDDWIPKSRYIWEKYNGEIPKGMCIIHKDGNKMNCDIDNLTMISLKDLIILNYNNLSIYAGEEILNTSLTISKLKQKKRKIEKEEKL